jgi:hypothetical protein
MIHDCVKAGTRRLLTYAALLRCTYTPRTPGTGSRAVRRPAVEAHGQRVHDPVVSSLDHRSSHELAPH